MSPHAPVPHTWVAERLNGFGSHPALQINDINEVSIIRLTKGRQGRPCGKPHDRGRDKRK